MLPATPSKNKITYMKTPPMLCLLLTSALATTPSAPAAVVNVFFGGVVDFLASDTTDFTEGDFIEGAFSYETTTIPNGSTGEYEDTIIGLTVGIFSPIPGEPGSFFRTEVISDEGGNIFVNEDEISFFFGPEPGQLGDNFNLTLARGSDPGVAPLGFASDLQTASDILVDETENGFVLNLFGSDTVFGTIDNGFTDGNLGFVPDSFDASVIPEPCSLTLLGLGGLARIFRRKR